MSDRTGIEYLEATWNPVVGCSHVSAGCDHCWAERMAKRQHVEWGRPVFKPERLGQPLHWRKPRIIGTCFMGDLFHRWVRYEDIDKILSMAAGCPQHTFVVLTKRPARMLAYLNQKCIMARILGPFPPRWPIPNIWLGVSVEDQATADERIPPLLQIPAAVRFVSVEPMLAQVDLNVNVRGIGTRSLLYNCLVGEAYHEGGVTQDKHAGRLDWVICGCETGPGARPMDLQWARNLRDQCVAAGVPFFLKRPGTLDDKQWRQWPEGVTP